MNRPRRPSLALVGTGGTIAGAGTAPEGGMSAAYQSAVVGADALVAGVPALARLAELRAEQLLQIQPLFRRGRWFHRKRLELRQ